jgi:hypothetical protein
VEIGAEAAQFPEKEYINGIFIAVQGPFSPTPSGQGGGIFRKVLLQSMGRKDVFQFTYPNSSRGVGGGGVHLKHEILGEN